MVSSGKQFPPVEDHCCTTPRLRNSCFADSREKDCDMRSSPVFETPVKSRSSSRQQVDAMSGSVERGTDNNPQFADPVVSGGAPQTCDTSKTTAPQGLRIHGETSSSRASISDVAPVILNKSEASSGMHPSFSQAHLNVTPSSSPGDARVARTIRISLKGDCIG